MIHRLLKKIWKEDTVQERYWFCNNQVFKESADGTREVEFIYSYFSTFKNARYVLWVEPTIEPGTRLMRVGTLTETEKINVKIPLLPIADEYRMMNGLIGLKKATGPPN